MQEYLNSTRRSVSAFKKAHDEGRLSIKPPFQRNPVWTDAQKSYLIDTILRGYPIPELYVQESVDAAGNEQFVIVDGQQRIRACLEFLEGKLALTPDEAPNWPDFEFEDLTPTEKQKVYGYNFIIRQLPVIPESEMRAIFRRLNRNVVALNRQELRHATYWGHFITLMEKISDFEYWTKSGLFTANDIRRMLDVEFISELTVAYLHGIPNKKATLEKWYATYESEFPDAQKVEAAFITVLAELGHVVPDIAHERWSKKSDFYSLFLCLASHQSSLPLGKAKRSICAAKLSAFAKAVDEVLATQSGGSANVKAYALNVERAASDQQNRIKRQNALEKLLTTVW